MPIRRRGNGERAEQLYLGPKVPRKPRRRRFHLAAILAAAVYASGSYVAYELARSALFDEGRVAGGAVDGGAAKAGGDDAQEVSSEEVTSQDRAALLALASRAQRSVYVLESSGSSLGSGFVAWTMQGDAYVMTAYRTVEGVLAQGGQTVFVRRGARIWTGELVRSHRPNGLALVRVGADLGRPLWQERAAADRLEPEGIALVVPAGPDAAVGEGRAGVLERGRVRVQAHGERLNVGAPVLGPDGRIAGVVTGVQPGGVNLVVPVEGACEAEIRRCR